MPKQTRFGVNLNMLTRQGTSPYDTRLYAGANPLTKRLRCVRTYGADDATAFAANSKERNYHNAGYLVWASTNTPGTYAQAANGNFDTFYRTLFRNMHGLTWGGAVSGSSDGVQFG